MITSAPVPRELIAKRARSTSLAVTLNPAAAEQAPQTCGPADVQARDARASDNERAWSGLPSARSADPNNVASAVAVPSANQHNDSTLRVMPLPAPSHAAQRVRVLPMAPRSSSAPLIAIVCLVVAGLAVGVYFALPYVIDWYKSESAPLQIDEAHAPKTIAQQPAAVAAPSSAKTTPKSKKAKGAKATKKKVGAAKKPRKQRGP